MGSTSYIGKPKTVGYRARSGSSAGSDKEMNGKLRRPKIRRPTKMTEYGLKRIPDYTELAYKEAVGKLRYFLSGNYAPSVRSYGGSPSIKNLDESDVDDKKYGSAYTLAEYKPRPRLTAKYSTLYADSLNNYAANTAPPPPAPAAASGELSGVTNPDVIHFIQKQEEYIEQLERESQYCRDELNNLLGKVKEVISENEHLHEAQKNKLISRMFHSYGSETDELEDLGDSTGIDSDNKTTPAKARKSKVRSTRLEGPNIVFESRISELEAQLAQSKLEMKKVQDENDENKRKLASGLVDSTCLDGFKRQIDNLQRDKSSLESQISKLKLNLEQKDGDLDGRYKRSDALEQQLREERNNLETEIRRLKDDLVKERNKVRDLASESARRAGHERSAAEQRYLAHCDGLEHDLAAQYDNVSKLQLDLERQRREENELKRELSMKNSAIEDLKMELKNKTSSLQADLSQAHAEKASLEEELASARLAIERHQRQAKHEANRLNSEIQSLRQRLDRADADLVHSRRENLRLSDQIATLEKELNMKNLTPISPEKNKKENQLSTMMESMENKHAKTVAELESMIHSQNSLMEKLTGECRLLTDKLDDANRRHKNELGALQRQVESLGRSIQPTYTPAHSTYQAPTTQSPKANRNVPLVASSTGQDYTGGITTGDPTPPDPNPRDSNIRKPALRDPAFRGVQPDELYRNDDTATKPFSKQGSRSSLLKETPSVDIGEFKRSELNNDNHEADYSVKDTIEQPLPIETNEYEPQQYPEGNYDQSQINNDQTEYDPNYQQPVYSEEQYGNYDQYQQQYADPNSQYVDPNAQYVDPNAQYEGQYENYGTDGNYDQQNYDASQYPESYQQQYEQSQSTAEEQESQQLVQDEEQSQPLALQPEEQVAPVEQSERIRSNSPNDRLTAKS